MDGRQFMRGGPRPPARPMMRGGFPMRGRGHPLGMEVMRGAPPRYSRLFVYVYICISFLHYVINKLKCILKIIVTKELQEQYYTMHKSIDFLFLRFFMK